MKELSFRNAFGAETMTGNRILIDEQLPQNADFFVLELMEHYGWSMILFNDSVDHFKELQKKRSIDTPVMSVYDTALDTVPISTDSSTDNAFCNFDMIDDYQFCKNSRFSLNSNARVHVYRSGTAAVEDYYDYSLIVKIGPLESGCSSKIDGEIRVFNRDALIYHYKYKIFSDRVVYYAYA